jgi:ligand-binding sensor domain-containing protein
LSEFDGTVWITYNSYNGLESDYVTAIARDAIGNLWFGSENGLTMYNGTTFTNYPSTDSPASNDVTTIASDPAGNLWVGVKTRCDIYECYGALSKFDGANWTTYDNAGYGKFSDITAIASDPAGNVWFGTGVICPKAPCYSEGIRKFDGASWTSYTTADGLAGNYVTTIASDSLGNMWFGTGFACFNGGQCSGPGVSKFDGTAWTTYTTGDGLADNYVTTITSDSAGNTWFGTDGYGVSKYDGSNWTTYTSADGLAEDLITAIASDPAGNIWLGTDKGVSKFDGTSWTTYTTANGLVSDWIKAIASDPSGNIWLGTDKGVSKFDGTSWTTYTEADGLVYDRVTLITSDANGNLWFGTPLGLSELYFIRSLNVNFANGAPGSYFNLASDHFPANQTVPVTINGSQLGYIPVSSNGVFTFTLSTAKASQGIYIVKVGEHPSVQIRLRMDTQQPIRPKEGDYPVIDIPIGIALTPQFYLPALRR